MAEAGWFGEAAKWGAGIGGGGLLGVFAKPALDYLRGRRGENREDKRLDLEIDKEKANQNDAVFARLEKIADRYRSDLEGTLAELKDKDARSAIVEMIAALVLDENNRFRDVVGHLRSPSLADFKPLSIDDFAKIEERFNKRRAAPLADNAFGVASFGQHLDKTMSPMPGGFIDTLGKIGDAT